MKGQRGEKKRKDDMTRAGGVRARVRSTLDTRRLRAAGPAPDSGAVYGSVALGIGPRPGGFAPLNGSTNSNHHTVIRALTLLTDAYIFIFSPTFFTRIDHNLFLCYLTGQLRVSQIPYSTDSKMEARSEMTLDLFLSSAFLSNAIYYLS